MKRISFLSLVNYVIRDIVTASLLMNVFRSCLFRAHVLFLTDRTLYMTFLKSWYIQTQPLFAFKFKITFKIGSWILVHREI